MKTLTLIYASLCIFLSQPIAASQVELTLSPAQPVLLTGGSQKTWVKINLHGIPLNKSKKRAPINVALVLDRSGSMRGEKMFRAKEAAILALNYLQKDDILSIITYSNTVNILVPATRFSDPESIANKIRQIHADGNTALFAGISKGAREIRKFLNEDKVNRIILISDGLANKGPSTPQELGRLGHRLGGDGISVTTVGLGLGYNEDLMVQLAGNSDGNHVFVEHANELSRIFRSEFGDLGSVVAQDVNIIIECPPGVKPIRILGRDAEIFGQKVVTRLNQLYANQEKYLTLEVEVDANSSNQSQTLAKVSVNWNDIAQQKRLDTHAQTSITYSSSKQDVAKQQNLPVLEAVTEQIAVEAADQAVQLRDSGQIDRAKAVLKKSRLNLEAKAKEYKSKRLLEQSKRNRINEEKLQDKDWAKTRKSIRSEQYQIETQQSYK